MKKSKTYIKICAYCNKEYKAHDSRSRYCCKSCKTQAYQERIKKGIHLEEDKRKLLMALQQAKRESEEREKRRLEREKELQAAKQREIERRNSRTVGQIIAEDVIAPSSLPKDKKILFGLMASLFGDL